jgi:plastocyanin
MEKKCFCRGGFFAGALLVIMLLAGQATWAATHIVQFGGSFGFTYSPSSFSATVGDTVTWQGDFTMHPLSSTTIPTSAQSWHNASGSSFSYRIAIPGAYNYQCDIHFSIGMVASFTANPSAVTYIAPSPVVDRTTIVTVTSSGKSSIRFTVTGTQRVLMSIMDLRGRALATIMDRSLTAGTYSVPLNGAIKAKGIYFVTIQGLGGSGREVFPVSIL